MTDLLAQAVHAARHLAPEDQDEIARMVLAYLGADRTPIALTAEELADLQASDREIAAGDILTDEEMRAIWAKYGA